jgi:geranylgeranyl diphosphate synthase type 3
MISFARTQVMLFQKLLQPISHVQQVPGKDIRARFTHAYNYWLKVPADKFAVVREITEISRYPFIV